MPTDFYIDHRSMPRRIFICLFSRYASDTEMNGNRKKSGVAAQVNVKRENFVKLSFKVTTVCRNIFEQGESVSCVTLIF